jgi:oligopeptide transport system substrate-binding protein
VRFVVVPDLATEERLFRNGRLHATESLDVDSIPFYTNKFPNIIRNTPYLGVYFFRFNVTRPGLDNVLVRRALNLAIDRDTLVNGTLHGAHAPAWGLTPPMQAPYELPRPLKYDIAQAKTLLAQAGYPGGKGFPKFSLLVNDQATHVRIAEVLQEMWKKNLGIDVGIRKESTSVFYDTQIRLDFDIARAGWIADFIEPISFLDMWTAGNQNNMTGWENAKFDQLIKDSYAEGDAAKRGAIMLEAENLFMDQSVVIPIYWYKMQKLVHPAVKGWNSKLLDNHPWQELDLGDEILPDIKAAK